MHNRRSFIRMTGSLTIGFVMGPSFSSTGSELGLNPELPGSLRRYPGIESWLEVLPDNRIRVFTGKIELGQGIGTAIKQVVAEELFCDLELVEVVLADTGLTPNEGYTAGSGSIKSSAMAVRYAAAAAREELCRLTAEKTGRPVDEFYLDNGQVKNRHTNQSQSVSELLQGKKWHKDVTLPVKLKPKDQYRYVGKPVPRKDLTNIISGESFFITDLRFPGMLHARILRPPAYSSTLNHLDIASIERNLSEGLQLVTNGRFIAVVGADEYLVIRNLEKISKQVEWSVSDPLPDQKNLKDLIVAGSTEEETVLDEVRNQGDFETTQVFRGSFFKPYVMHASIGPACGIAHYKDDRLEVWTHSQGVFPFRAALATMLDMKEENIRVTGIPGPGCYGHNSSDDAAADATVIARTIPGRYIRVQWTRVQENEWEALGCAMRMDVEAGLSDQGRITYWNTGVWTDSHSTRPNADAGTLLTARYLDSPANMQNRGYLGGGYRNAEPYYKVLQKKIVAHYYDGPLRVSSLRSLGAYANIFAVESIIDEMSVALSLHPLDFRIRNLEDSRAIEVLQKLKESTDQVNPSTGEGLGYAFSRYKNSDAYCAVAVLARINAESEIELIKMWAVVDAGEVINPDGLTQQTEGGMLQAASWTLLEEVQFDTRHIISGDWTTYPVFRFRDIPLVEVVLLDRPDEPALGGGEVAMPPVPAAITNAIYRITGERMYDLPVRKHQTANK